jgi:hypothetical protein
MLPVNDQITPWPFGPKVPVLVKVMGPTKLPENIVPFGWPYLPTPTMLKVELTAEKVAPELVAAIEPATMAPVEKPTEPKDFPGLMPLKDLNCDPLETIPVLATETVPKVLDRVIVSAQVAIGSANARTAKNNTRLIVLTPPKFFIQNPGTLS